MSPEFPAAAHALAAALVGVFPDLTFAPDPAAGTLVITAGTLTLTVAPLAAPEAAAPEAGAADEPLTLDEATRAGAFAGESRYVALNGPAARNGFRDRAHQGERVGALAGADFLTMPEGSLSGDEFLALSQARIQAQNRMLGYPQDADLRARYDLLQRRWAAEIKAHRATETTPAQTEPTAAEVYPRADGYQGD